MGGGRAREWMTYRHHQEENARPFFWVRGKSRPCLNASHSLCHPMRIHSWHPWIVVQGCHIYRYPYLYLTNFLECCVTKIADISDKYRCCDKCVSLNFLSNYRFYLNLKGSKGLNIQM